jgi:hypothetical protein
MIVEAAARFEEFQSLREIFAPLVDEGITVHFDAMIVFQNMSNEARAEGRPTQSAKRDAATEALSDDEESVRSRIFFRQMIKYTLCKHVGLCRAFKIWLAVERKESLPRSWIQAYCLAWLTFNSVIKMRAK